MAHAWRSRIVGAGSLGPIAEGAATTAASATGTDVSPLRVDAATRSARRASRQLNEILFGQELQKHVQAKRTAREEMQRAITQRQMSIERREQERLERARSVLQQFAPDLLAAIAATGEFSAQAQIHDVEELVADMIESKFGADSRRGKSYRATIDNMRDELEEVVLEKNEAARSYYKEKVAHQATKQQIDGLRNEVELLRLQKSQLEEELAAELCVARAYVSTTFSLSHCQSFLVFAFLTCVAGFNTSRWRIASSSVHKRTRRHPKRSHGCSIRSRSNRKCSRKRVCETHDRACCTV
jgi:hypothetical protein